MSLEQEKKNLSKDMHMLQEMFPIMSLFCRPKAQKSHI